MDGLHRLGGDVALLVPVILDREHDVHQRQDAEDQRLDQVEHEFEPEQQHGQDDDRQRGDHAERDLTTVDVAEETHRQRQRADEIEQELGQADEHRDQPAPMPFLNS